MEAYIPVTNYANILVILMGIMILYIVVMGIMMIRMLFKIDKSAAKSDKEIIRDVSNKLLHFK